MPNIGPLEIAIVLVIVLIIFGPKRLPGLGKQLGTGMREFKDDQAQIARAQADAPVPPSAPAEPQAAPAPAPASTDEPTRTSTGA